MPGVGLCALPSLLLHKNTLTVCQLGAMLLHLVFDLPGCR